MIEKIKQNQPNRQKAPQTVQDHSQKCIPLTQDGAIEFSKSTPRVPEATGPRPPSALEGTEHRFGAPPGQVKLRESSPGNTALGGLDDSTKPLA